MGPPLRCPPSTRPSSRRSVERGALESGRPDPRRSSRESARPPARGGRESVERDDVRRSSRESRESLRDEPAEAPRGPPADLPAPGRPALVGLPAPVRPPTGLLLGGRPEPFGLPDRDDGAGLPLLDLEGAPGRPPLDGRPEEGFRSDPPRELPAAGIAIPFDVPQIRGIVATNNKGHPKVAFVEKLSGGVLLSHTVTRAVPSALRGLASGFGMEPGVSLSLWPPKLY